MCHFSFSPYVPFLLFSLCAIRPAHLCFLYLLILTYYARLFTLRSKWSVSIDCGYMNGTWTWMVPEPETYMGNSAFDLCSIFRSVAIWLMVKKAIEVASFIWLRSSWEREPMTLKVSFWP
jgi:hypothetical protein